MAVPFTSDPNEETPLPAQVNLEVNNATMQNTEINNAPDENDGIASGLANTDVVIMMQDFDENGNVVENDQQLPLIEPQRIIRNALNRARIRVSRAEGQASVMRTGLWYECLTRVITRAFTPQIESSSSLVDANNNSVSKCNNQNGDTVDSKAGTNGMDEVTELAVNDDPEISTALTIAQLIDEDSEFESVRIIRRANIQRDFYLTMADTVGNFIRVIYQTYLRFFTF